MKRWLNYFKRFVAKTHIFWLLTVSTIAFLVFKPSFSLAFSGDDWLAFFRYRYHVGEWSSGQINLLTYLLTPYGSQDITMGLLRKGFGLQAPHLYYLISFFFRLLASFSIFLVVRLSTKSILGGFIAALFFATTIIGADATNWVFNMPSYIGLACFILFLYFFILAQQKGSLKSVLAAALFYFLAFLVAPIRMHGLPLLVIALDLFLLITDRKRVKEIIVRQAVFIAVFLLIRSIGDSMGQASDTIQKLSGGVDFMITSLSNRDFSFLLNPFVIVGRFLLPENVWPLVGKIIPNARFNQIAFLCVLVAIPFLVFFRELQKEQKTGKNYLFYLIAFAFLWTLIVKILAGKNLLLPLPDPAFVGPAILGGYLAIFGILLTLKYINTRYGAIIFASFSWIFLSFAFPWLWNPNALLGTNHRYLIMSASGMALFWGTLTSLSKKTRLKILTTTVALVFIAIHSTLTNNFFSKLEEVRSAKLWNEIWSSFPNVREINNDPPIIIYFEGDSAIIYHILSFGFPANVAVIFDMKDGNTLPVPITEWKDLVKTITSGENMPAYGYEKKPIEVNKIYAFELSKNSTMNDITSQTRKKLDILVKK